MNAYWALARPKLLPFVWILVGLGYGWGHWDRALMMQGIWSIPWVFASWTCLHAGSLWLNADLDRDEGEVLLGQSVQVPEGAARAGWAALAACVGLGWIGGIGWIALLGAVLAGLYSHPWTAWKGHPIGGPVVNLLGYGLLSPLAGWWVLDVPPNPRTLAMWGLGGLAILGTYFAAQAFQQEEDAARGYRTLVVTHGPRGVLTTARICLGVAFAGAVVLAVVGWLPRACLVLAPLWLWIDRYLAWWGDLPGGGSSAEAVGFTVRLLVGVSLTMVVVSMIYLDDSLANRPVAGLGTVAGHPVDRPRLPPASLYYWELQRGDVVVRPAERSRDR